MKTDPHDRLFSHYPFLQLALAFSAGVFISSKLSTPLVPVVSACAICSFIALIALAKRRVGVCGIALLTAMFFAGTTLAIVERSTDSPGSFKQLLDENGTGKRTWTITGILAGPPEFARDRLYLLVRVESVSTDDAEIKSEGLVSLLASFKTPTSEQEYRQLDLHYGSRLRVKSTLHRVDQYRNPGVSTLTEYLDRKGYDATGVIKAPTSIAVLPDAPVFKPLAWLYEWRQRIQRDIDQHFSPETAGVLDAALLGNRYNLSRSTSERFRDGGTFHVLVISGLHISFIGGIVFLIAKRLTRKPLLQFIGSSTIVWCYTLAVGAEASVVRAAIMFTFVAFGGVLVRSATPLNALGAAALVLLLTRPKDLFDPSLQLTFLSVLAIVTIAWPLLQNFDAIGAWRPTRSTPYPPTCSRTLRTICEMLYWSEREWRQEIDRSAHHYRVFKTPFASWLERVHLQRLTRYVCSAIIVSIAVQLMLLPLLIVYFHRLSLSSLVLNIVVSLLLGILGVVAFVALLLSHISLTVAEPFFALASTINWLMVHSIDPFAKVGLASIRLPEYSGWTTSLYFVYYFPLLILVTRLFRWRPLSAPGPKPRADFIVAVSASLQIALVAVVLLHPFSARRTNGMLRVDFLDVGQGDAALVTMPDGTTLLIDGGGRPVFRSREATGSEAEVYERESRSVGEMVVSEYLWWLGLHGVDYLMATHADADHMDGLNDVVRNFSVRSALVGRTPADDSEYSKFAQTLRSTKTQVEVVQAGDVLHFGEVTACVLWPNGSDEVAKSQNNDSIVLLLKFGVQSILFTGDIEKDAERQLVANNRDLMVDVVKVPHHGSRTSSTEAFVRATKPGLAIISVGQTSMFGHPHREVVERWTSAGAEVLTTGRSGTISVITDGKALTVKKYLEE